MLGMGERVLAVFHVLFEAIIRYFASHLLFEAIQYSASRILFELFHVSQLIPCILSPSCKASNRRTRQEDVYNSIILLYLISNSILSTSRVLSTVSGQRGFEVAKCRAVY